jgi:hypothetical protein
VRRAPRGRHGSPHRATRRRDCRAPCRASPQRRRLGRAHEKLKTDPILEVVTGGAALLWAMASGLTPRLSSILRTLLAASVLTTPALDGRVALAQTSGGTVCSYGLNPGIPKAWLIPAAGKAARERSVRAARELRDQVQADAPLVPYSHQIADLLLLDGAHIASVPAWRIDASTGYLAPAGGDGTIGRRDDAIAIAFPGGAQFALNIVAVRFTGELTRIRLLWFDGKPRVLLDMRRAIDVSRKFMSAEPNCGVVELRLDER